MLFGSSLSFVISKVLRGDAISLDELVIISGTRVPDFATLERLITDYQNLFWNVNPKLAAEICRKLFAEGRVIQPRLLFPDDDIPDRCEDIFNTLDEYVKHQLENGREKLMDLMFPEGPKEERLAELIAQSKIS